MNCNPMFKQNIMKSEVIQITQMAPAVQIELDLLSEGKEVMIVVVEIALETEEEALKMRIFKNLAESWLKTKIVSFDLIDSIASVI